MFVVRGGALSAALEPPECGVLTTLVFHPAAQGRSNIGIHPTRFSSDVVENLDVFEVACGRVMPGVRPLRV